MNGKIVARWGPAIVWMVLIFYLSAQPAQQSSELSSSVMDLILQWVGSWFTVDESVFHLVVRKGAHMTAYGILAMLTMFALEGSRTAASIWRQVGLALIICLVYATTDEVHQLFVLGRSGEVTDVGIDAVGAVLGIIIYIILQACFDRFKSNK